MLGGLSNPFAGCCGGAEELPADLLMEPEAVEAPEGDATSLKLHMCVYSATDLYNTGGSLVPLSTYVNMRIGGAEGAKEEDPSHDSAGTKGVHPVYEDLWETEYDCSGNAPVLRFTIWEDKMALAQNLGTAMIVLPKEPQRVKRQILKLKDVPSGLNPMAEPPPSVLCVMWYVSGINDKAPPLNLKDIASMGPSATARQELGVRLSLREFEGKKAPPGDEIVVNAKLVDHHATAEQKKAPP